MCAGSLSCPTILWPHGLRPARLLSVFGTSQARILEWLPFRKPGNLPDQRSNPCLLHFLHWQADSLPLHHLEDPKDHTMRKRTTYPCLLYPLLISMSKISFYQSNRYSYKTQFQLDCFKPWVYFFMFLLDYNWFTMLCFSQVYNKVSHFLIPKERYFHLFSGSEGFRLHSLQENFILFGISTEMFYLHQLLQIVINTKELSCSFPCITLHSNREKSKFYVN